MYREIVTNALTFFVKGHVIILGAVWFLFGERNVAVKFISSCPTSFLWWKGIL